VNFVKKGKAKTEEVISNYKGSLTESEVLITIEELKKTKCLELDEDIIMITQLGKNIL